MLNNVEFSGSNPWACESSSMLPIFSMNKMGTVFAILSDIQSTQVSITIFREDAGNVWSNTQYKLGAQLQQRLGRCALRIGIALDNSGTAATLFGLVIRVQRVNFVEDGLVTIDNSSIISFVVIASLSVPSKHLWNLFWTCPVRLYATIVADIMCLYFSLTLISVHHSSNHCSTRV